jgi:putative ABC transport system permease protein
LADTHWAKVGDIVTIRYIEEWEYFDPNNGEILLDGPEDGRNWNRRAKVYRDVAYEVAALVSVPNTLSYRYYGNDEFVLNDETFRRDSGGNSVMYYAYDTTDAANTDMEAFLSDYTENVQPQYDYESRETYVEEFRSFQNMFLVLGGMLSFIVGLVGVLNFLNAVLTGILARRREFAVLQSIGMTGKQLKTMLVWEGLYYTLSSLAVTLLFTVIAAPVTASVLGNMFWFFSYRFTVWPVLAVLPVFALFGACLPLLAYHFVAKRSLIERLREAGA